MNKSAIKNFAIWARNKLIADISYKAGLLGVTDKEIKPPLPQSTKDAQFFDIGSREPYQITGAAIVQRKALADKITERAKQSDYATAYKAVIEEVAYTWFNRLIAVRFMEVNDYLPSRVRVLSSATGKTEPDIVTTPFDTDLEFTATEREYIIACKTDNKLDELFRMLFIKQCVALRSTLPVLFNSSDDESILLNIAFTDREGIVWHLINDIPEKYFRIRTSADDEAIARGDMSEEDAPAGQVEIIGWLYQYYNTELKDETFALLKQNVKITKERIPAATQLFTPDWIVRYMVENSLGRLWIERQTLFTPQSDDDEVPGDIADNLLFGWKYYVHEAQQEPAVNEQLYALREQYPIKSPEDIAFIDPCMGSGHILVYAFDALMQIYESAGYTRRDAARLIIEKNLYGYDIDLRAHQLTYFALAMKVRQHDRSFFSRRFQFSGFCSDEVSFIKAEHILQLKNKDAERLYALFADAETVGSLTKVDDDINLDALSDLVLKDVPNLHQISMDDVAFRTSMVGFLGVVNTAKLLRRKYDVVCTNPPYMGSSGMSGKLAQFVKDNYPDSKSDLFAAFIEQCRFITKPQGYFAMITQHAWMFLSSYEKLRTKLQAVDTVNMAHLGARAFAEIGGEVVQSTAFVIRDGHISGFKGTYVRLVDIDDAEGKEREFLSGNHRYTATADNFAKIPGSPVAYWVSANIYGVFSQKNGLDSYGKALQGSITGDNDRFLKIWFEVSIEGVSFDTDSARNTDMYKWYPHSKGGEYRRWYGNNEYVINWHNNGAEIRSFVDGSGKLRSRPQNIEYFFQEGITWSDLTMGKFGARYVDKGYTFNVTGPTFYAKDGRNLSAILAYFNSPVFQMLLAICCPGLHYHNGVISTLPIASTAVVNESISVLSGQNIALSRADWDSFETSWDFKRHPLIIWRASARFYRENEVHEHLISDSFELWRTDTEYRFMHLKRNEEELNRIFIEIYGLQDELTPEVADKDVTVARIYDIKEDIPESMKGNGYVLTRVDVIKSFVSYAVGCMFGRYSLDVEGLAYAGGEWDMSKYSSFIPDRDNILPITDDEYLPDDIVTRFVEFVRVVYGSGTLEENLRFIADALGSKGSTAREVIRNYFLRDFFKDHVKTYKKRPIYWLFDSGKADGFKALIYLHRYDQDTIGRLRVDYLHKLQRVYESEIARMRETIEKSGDAREVSAAQKRLEKLIKQLKEAKEYDEKIAHLALSRIALDLDDGVKVNYEKLQTGTDGKKHEVLGKI